jgi:3-dehydroquinate dehydratase-2
VGLAPHSVIRKVNNIIFVLNGPNLNLLGMREPHIYGSLGLDAIKERLKERARELKTALDFRQSNHEGLLIDWLHEAHASRARAVLLTAGGYTHTSVALRDAVAAISVPVIEVHLSNPFAREPFRHDSLIAPVARGTICGFGADSYVLGLHAAMSIGSEPSKVRRSAQSDRSA